MLPHQENNKRHSSRGSRRIPSGSRTLLACAKCKEKKLKCDNKVPGCNNCLIAGSVCLVEDPVTRTYRPRNYIEILEKRIALLESLLKQCRPDLAYSDVFKHHALQPNSSSLTQHIEIPHHQHGDQSALPIAKDNVEADDGVDKLASRVGLLSLNAAGAEPQYLGSSSIFAFSRLINSYLRQVVSHDPSMANVLDYTESRSSVLPSPCLLPAYESAVKLSDSYFQNVNTHYPFLHEPTFRAWETMLVNESTGLERISPSSISLFFLNMVYAVGALLLPDLGYSAERLYISALLYIDDILAYDNLEAVQAMLCCAIYSLRSSTGTSHWKVASLALRLCIDLGYHRNTKHFAPPENILQVELRKRVFWCAYAMETQAAVMLGRPLGVPYQEVDAEYPIDIDDLLIKDTGLVGAPRSSPSDVPTNMTRAIHTFRIRRLLNRIYTCLYSKADPRCSGKHDQQVDVKNIRAEIEKWRSEIPPTASHSGEELVLFTSVDWYDLEYNYTILQLYRAQIVDHPTQATEDVFIDCLRAAESICQSYRRQFLGTPMSCTWAALHELFLAGLTYLHCLWTSPVAREVSGRGQANSTCNDCTIALTVMADRWDVATPFRETFVALASRTMAMMSEQADENVSKNVPSADSENWAEEDSAEWMRIVTGAGVLRALTGF
ncbi:transcriptional regulator family: Fungal Specific TF [Penicillium canescens]|nr:transcriptional regulator family: Fungal Specific TF [Penicillium canescens]KAJ6170302.1 transcriptional regulator family: Fungal Specific TF [Penicillium canescens]